MSRYAAQAPRANLQPLAEQAKDIAHPAVSALDIWAFVLPALSSVEITIVGQLIVSEILMLAMLPWLWGARRRLPLPAWFVVLWAGWFVSQVLSDIVAGSAFADFVRGWAAIIFTFTNFAAILALASTLRRARLFALGLAVGGGLGYLMFPTAITATDPWKWALGWPIGLVLAAALSGSWGARHRGPTIGAFVVFGTLNLLFGFRSLGGLSLLTAAYLAFGAAFGRQRATSKVLLWRGVFGLVLLAASVVGVLQVYDFSSSSGLLGPVAQAKYEAQSGTLGVLVGGRSEILASSQAIIDAPILGHGSWAKDFKYVDLLADRLSSFGYEIGGRLSDVGLIPSHSYLLGSWVWAGFLGGLFWIAIAVLAVRLLLHLYSTHVEIAAILVFFTMNLLWAIAFSPYGSIARITAMYGVALCLLGFRVIRGDHPDDRLARSPSSASRYPVSRHYGLAFGPAGGQATRSHPLTQSGHDA